MRGLTGRVEEVVRLRDIRINKKLNKENKKDFTLGFSLLNSTQRKLLEKLYENKNAKSRELENAIDGANKRFEQMIEARKRGRET